MNNSNMAVYFRERNECGIIPIDFPMRFGRSAKGGPERFLHRRFLEGSPIAASGLWQACWESIGR